MLKAQYIHQLAHIPSLPRRLTSGVYKIAHHDLDELPV
jgi:hypothetical protein